MRNQQRAVGQLVEAADDIIHPRRIGDHRVGDAMDIC